MSDTTVATTAPTEAPPAADQAPVAVQPAAATPTIDPAIQAWVRRELHLAACGVGEDERVVMNP